MGAFFASRTKLVVLFNHWFMPYKVERRRSYFQCGTSKNCLGVHMSFLEAKNAPTKSFKDIQLYFKN